MRSALFGDSQPSLTMLNWKIAVPCIVLVILAVVLTLLMPRLMRRPMPFDSAPDRSVGEGFQVETENGIYYPVFKRAQQAERYDKAQGGKGDAQVMKLNDMRLYMPNRGAVKSSKSAHATLRKLHSKSMKKPTAPRSEIKRSLKAMMELGSGTRAPVGRKRVRFVDEPEVATPQVQPRPPSA